MPTATYSVQAYERAANFFDTQMVQPLRQMLIGRQVIAKTTPLPEGKYSVDYNKLTDMSAASISRGVPDVAAMFRDEVRIDRQNLQLLTALKGYVIPKQEFDAFMSIGQPLDAAMMVSAAQKVGEREDHFLLQGWNNDGSTYDQYGLYQQANANGLVSGSSFSTFGGAVASIEKGIKQLLQNYVRGVNFNLVLNFAEFMTLQGSLSTLGVEELPLALKRLNIAPTNPAKGNIFYSPEIAAGTGLLVPVDTEGLYLDLVVAQDYANDVGVDSKIPKISPIYGTTYLVEALRIKQPTSIIGLSGIA